MKLEVGDLAFWDGKNWVIDKSGTNIFDMLTADLASALARLDIARAFLQRIVKRDWKNAQLAEEASLALHEIDGGSDE